MRAEGVVLETFGPKMRSSFDGMTQISEDLNVGSEQKIKHFWYKVLEQYNEQAKINKLPVLTKNMLAEKWTPINREVERFNSLVKETRVMSGENDDDWLTRVDILHKTVAITEFKHKSAWLFLKDKHKWKNRDLNFLHIRISRGRRTTSLRDIKQSGRNSQIYREFYSHFTDEGFRLKSQTQRLNRGWVTDKEPELFGDDQLPRPPDKQRIGRTAKMERMDRETAAIVDLINSQKVAEDLRIL
ncbi:hypothetical protein Tco_0844123 [Tanacetum coccineum]